MTEAKKIEDLFAGDGQTWESADGLSIESECDARAHETDRRGDVARYVFADRSVIVVYPTFWAVGASELCWCCADVGHDIDCTLRARIENLCVEAGTAGDAEQARLCRLALAGDDAAWSSCVEAIGGGHS